MNSVNLIGRLARDPEVTYTPQTQTAVCRFTLAVSRNNGKDETDWIPCVAFNKTAENLQRYQKKGSQISVEGRIQTGSYTNKDGQKIYTTDVMVNRIEFLGSKQDAEPRQEQRQEEPRRTRTRQRQEPGQGEYYDGLPFSEVNDDIPF